MPLRGKRRLVRKLQDRSDALVRELATEALERLVRRTPAATGRARANWNVAEGTPDTSTTETTDKSGRATIARGRSEVGSLDRKSGTVYVTNSLPYVDDLERGESDQAPAGFVAVTVPELPSLLRRIVAKLRRGG